jgi:hypothetical protein
MPWIQNVALADIPRGHHIRIEENSMLIQIVDPDMEFPTPKHGFKEVHKFKFLDIEEDGLTNDGDGNYDGSIYDAIAFDFGPRPSNGFDNYAYDDVFFDFAVPTQQAISLNANYQFRVTITDGVVATQRLFRIFVVGNDQFRADNTATTGLASTFTADATYIRQPVWISKSDLGLFRANNYLTIPLAYTMKILLALE